MKIDWKRKLGSRKFWTAAAGFIGAAAVLVCNDESIVASVTAMISAAGVLIAYILGESMIDAEYDRNDSTENE